MGLFGKKTCPVCEGKTGFITYRLAGGEKICPSCEKILRGKYNLVRQGAAFHDTLNELEFSRAKQIIDRVKAVQREDIARFGDTNTAIMSVLDTFLVPSDGLDEGGPDIAALAGRTVALAFCEKGSFKQGDRVCVLTKEGETRATVIKLIPCSGAYPFEEELIAGTHSTECAENTNAWIILDPENTEIDRQDKIFCR